jgi:DNA-binding NarL/FixJ family response regulator
MIRTVLFTTEPILAQGFAGITRESDGNIDLVASCGSLPELHRTLESGRVDVLILDLGPEVTFTALSTLKRSAPDCRIVLWVNAIATELAWQAMGLGVSGILRKTLRADLVLKCIQKVAQGELWFEKALTDNFLSAKRVSLTKREGQLVALISQGLKNKEIARSLMITEGTVKVYLSKLFHKVGVKDRFELALYGLKNLTAGPNLESSGSVPARDVDYGSPLRSLVIGTSRPGPLADSPAR